MYPGPKSLLLGVSGGIAAYKACELARHFVRLGVSVQVIMTENAARFVTPFTFESLTNRSVFTSMWKEKDHLGADGTFRHIDLGKGVGLFLVAPATANVIAKFAHGIADDLVSATYLCADCPVAVAPAMNSRMWRHPATMRNVERLSADGATIILPESGDLACGETGDGRLASVASIAAAAEKILGFGGPLSGRRALVVTGPTREAFDPVRYISNNSTGEFGRIVARQLVQYGADVTLIEANPTGVRQFEVDARTLSAVSARELREVTLETAKDGYDWVFMFAAVADYTPKEVSGKKLKKESGDRELALVLTADILAELSALGIRHKLVGVSAETENVIANSEKKLKEKSLHAILAVDVSGTNPPFGSNELSGMLLFGSGKRVAFPSAEKELVAEQLVKSLLWEESDGKEA